MFDDFLFGFCDFDGDGHKDDFEFAAEAFLVNEMLEDDEDDYENDFDDEEW